MVKTEGNLILEVLQKNDRKGGDMISTINVQEQQRGGST